MTNPTRFSVSFLVDYVAPHDPDRADAFDLVIGRGTAGWDAKHFDTRQEALAFARDLPEFARTSRWEQMVTCLEERCGHWACTDRLPTKVELLGILVEGLEKLEG